MSKERNPAPTGPNAAEGKPAPATGAPATVGAKALCRNCGKPLGEAAPENRRYFPFCCQRCQLVDLGQWLDERYRIQGEKARSCGDGSSGGAQQ